MKNIDIDIEKTILENVDKDILEEDLRKTWISIKYCIDKDLEYRTPPLRNGK